MPKLVSVAEMLAIEKAADAAGLTYAHMMENAGASLAASILAHSQHIKEKSALALVGKGNNGGDALVALAALASRGWATTALLVDRATDEYVERLRSAGGGVVEFGDDPDLEDLLRTHAILLDGLLGTGIKLPLRPPMPDVLEQIGRALTSVKQPPFTVAVDCPSGMDCDSGELASQTLRADLTVCMAAVKRGMLTLPAYEYLGDLEVVGIGLPEDLPAWAALNRSVVDAAMVRAALPARPADAHKGTFGTALIVAGSERYPGAAFLAGSAAARSGAGLISMAAIKKVQAMLVKEFPEAVWLPLPEEDGGIAAAAAPLVLENLGRAGALLLGPGFGLAPATRAFIDSLLAASELPPLVIDADGLKLLAQIEDWPARLPAGSILTPHPGEMAVLTGLENSAIQADRLALAERFAKEWNQILVLKGAFTVIAAPDGRTAVLPIASSALATAGTGDVLAGLITGLRAQGMSAFEAAYCSAWLHAQAGLRAAQRVGGEAGVIAGDLLDEIPALLKE